MGIKSIERKEKIREILEKDGRVFVSDLVSLFNISDVSVRKDLEDLEKENILKRTYGGGVKQEGTIASEFFFGEKAKRNIKEKKAIARKAFELIIPGQTIFFDAGTTTLEIGKLLAKSGKNLVVVTTSLPMVSELSRALNIKVFILGGFLRRELMDFSGYFLAGEIANFSFDQIFLGVDAISAERGMTTMDKSTAEIEEAAMSRSRVINIVADYSKIGRNSLIPYGHIKERTDCRRIITDSRADMNELEVFKKFGFEIRIA